MNSLVDAFFNICADKFRYLIEQFTFKQTAKKADSGVYRVVYKNRTTAIEVGLEWSEQYIYVEMYRLVEGRIKDNPIIIHPESELTVFNLEDLLEIRATSLKLTSGHFDKTLTIEIIEKVLTHYASALKRYATDILQGDFGVFDELERIVKNRLAHNSEDVNNSVELYEADKVGNRLDALVRELVEQDIPFEEVRAEFEKRYILSMLDHAKGNLQRAAQLLNMPRTTLAKHLKKHPRMRHYRTSTKE